MDEKVNSERALPFAENDQKCNEIELVSNI